MDRNMQTLFQVLIGVAMIIVVRQLCGRDHWLERERSRRSGAEEAPC
jgi:hypothetical protein